MFKKFLAACIFLSIILPDYSFANKNGDDLEEEILPSDILQDLLEGESNFKDRGIKRNRKYRETCLLFDDPEQGVIAYGYHFYNRRNKKRQNNPEKNERHGVVYYYYMDVDGTKVLRPPRRKKYEEGASCGNNQNSNGYTVSGTVTDSIRNEREISPALRNASVYLRSKSDFFQISQDVLTDGNGQFTLSNIAPGSYQICVGASLYDPVCIDQISVQEDLQLDPISLEASFLKRKNKRRVFTGKVYLQGGEPGVYINDDFDVNDTSVVTLWKKYKNWRWKSFLRFFTFNDNESINPIHQEMINRGMFLVGAARVNNDGTYLINTNRRGELTILASMQSGRGEVEINTRKKVLPDFNFILEQDVSIDNNTPVVGFNDLSEQPLPGSVVNISLDSNDSEEHDLTYLFSVSAGTYQVDNDAKSIQWTLPLEPQTLKLEVLANDNHGGYSFTTFPIYSFTPSVGEFIEVPKEIVGSGILIDQVKVAENVPPKTEITFYGGLSGDLAVDLVHQYNLESRETEKLEEIFPFPVGGISVIRDNERIFFLGGSDGDSAADGVFLKDNQGYAPHSFLPNPIFRPCVVKNNSQIYFSGGINNDINGEMFSSDIVYAFNPDAYRDYYVEETKIPAKKIGATCHASKGKLYIIGGITDEGYDTKNYSYDFTSKVWSELAPTPKGIFAHSSLIVGEAIYMVGGTEENGVNLQIYKYNLSSNSWTSPITLKTPVQFPNLAAIDGKLHVFPGATIQSETIEVQIYSIN